MIFNFTLNFFLLLYTAVNYHSASRLPERKIRQINTQGGKVFSVLNPFDKQLAGK